MGHTQDNSLHQLEVKFTVFEIVEKKNYLSPLSLDKTSYRYFDLLMQDIIFFF